MKPISISVLIATRNRSRLLKHCLQSLATQTNMPYEVIVVDNNSSDDTKAVVEQFHKTLSIKYIHEANIGLPYARNTSIEAAKGNILAFIDDDCVASSDWIYKIREHFTVHKESNGMVGLSKNSNRTNPYSTVEYVYYLRWVLQNIQKINNTEIIQSGMFIDFKNAAFIRNVLNNVSFSRDIPFGDVGMEDVEIGKRILTIFPHVYYSSSVRVYHTYSTTLYRLFFRNFWEGYGNNKLFTHHAINIRRTPNHVPMIIFLYNNMFRKNNSIQFTPWVIILCMLFSIASKLGRVYAIITDTFRFSVTIPQRT